ncbi:cupin domain-containing protein [Microvirga subterranea]|uniref:Quercetin dioxygenase-like cupin family protein n=1 Tax=Microvirga subterranea TaxID=186651 RepID=A0A370HE59_9HYPH|nr:cupin domain-containing protein [Microvirga subterranea]RDI54861.1 quercetin dioxygenase-like cupin family protein [Microvirga subterranea]
MSNQVSSRKAEALWFGNTLVKILLSSSHGRDGTAVIEHRMPHGDSPPMHVHRNEDEIFHIIEGKMRFQVGQEQIVVGAGETVVAPKGIPHTFRVESADGVRCLTVTKGPDFEGLIRMAGRPVTVEELPPAMGAPTPEMIEALIKACQTNNIDVVGAPLS